MIFVLCRFERNEGIKCRCILDIYIYIYIAFERTELVVCIWCEIDMPVISCRLEITLTVRVNWRTNAIHMWIYWFIDVLLHLWFECIDGTTVARSFTALAVPHHLSQSHHNHEPNSVHTHARTHTSETMRRSSACFDANDMHSTMCIIAMIVNRALNPEAFPLKITISSFSVRNNFVQWMPFLVLCDYNLFIRWMLATHSIHFCVFLFRRTFTLKFS